MKPPPRCKTCHGTGRIDPTRRLTTAQGLSAPMIVQLEPCEDCGGSGVIVQCSNVDAARVSGA